MNEQKIFQVGDRVRMTTYALNQNCGNYHGKPYGRTALVTRVNGSECITVRRYRDDGILAPANKWHVNYWEHETTQPA